MTLESAQFDRIVVKELCYCSIAPFIGIERLVTEMNVMECSDIEVTSL